MAEVFLVPGAIIGGDNPDEGNIVMGNTLGIRVFRIVSHW